MEYILEWNLENPSVWILSVQGPKGYIAQICEVDCSTETVQQNCRFNLFLVNSTLIYILFTLQ